MNTLRPSTADEVCEAVRDALIAGAALELLGGGSKRGMGRPVEAARQLDASRLCGIVDYDPAELVLTARAGTALQEIETLLAANGQCLGFEPIDLRALFGATAAVPTLGGCVAAGLAGPRRLRAGSVRDHVLGVTAVSGRAEVFTAGGKVVKNVTGYDLPKLLTGSQGTLAVLTEISLRTLPMPEDERTLLFTGLAVHAALALCTSALQAPLEISGACYAPAGLPLPFKPTDDSWLALRLEGVRPSVEARLVELQQRLQPVLAAHSLEREPSRIFWRAVRDVIPFADSQSILWRLSVPPAQAAATLARIEQAVAGAIALLDWGGGLIWLNLPEAVDAHADLVRGALNGGHATLMRAPKALRTRAEVFQPLPPPLAALSARIKQQFDPRRVLNPGRMYAGV